MQKFLPDLLHVFSLDAFHLTAIREISPSGQFVSLSGLDLESFWKLIYCSFMLGFFSRKNYAVGIVLAKVNSSILRLVNEEFGVF